MTDRETIKRVLELEIKWPTTWECRPECPYGKHECGECYAKFTEDMVELLKAKPVIDRVDRCGEMFGRCPKCGEYLYKANHRHFCANCGQEVLWDA